MTPKLRWNIVRFSATTGTLTAFWMLFSGALTTANLAAGLACSSLIALTTFDVFIENHEVARRSVLPRIVPSFVFALRLVFEMYRSSLRTLRSVATGRATPRVVHFRSRLRSDLARVVLAEAITFTPGTITLELDEDHYVVHWLNATTRHSGRAGEEVKGKLERAIERVWM